MKIGTKNIIALSGLILLTGACTNGTDSKLLNGGPAKVGVSMQLSSNQTPMNPSRAMSPSDHNPSGITNLVISTARINVARIDLKLPEGGAQQCSSLDSDVEDDMDKEEEVSCEDDSSDDSLSEGEDHIRFTGPFVFDLVAKTSNPSLSNLNIPSGVYHEVKIKLAPANPADGLITADDPLANNSIVVTGTYTDANNVIHDFSISSKLSKELKVENKDGIEIAEGSNNEIVALFNSDTWFSGINPGTCSGGSDDLKMDHSDEESHCEGLLDDRIEDSLELD